MAQKSTSFRILTGDEFLDRMLDWRRGGRGFLSSIESPTSIVIKGGPGAGKSMLALQMAREYVLRSKSLCTYYALEESPKHVAERLFNFDPTLPCLALTKWPVDEKAEVSRFVRRVSTDGGILVVDFVPSPETDSKYNDELLENMGYYEATIQHLIDMSEKVKNRAKAATAPNLIVVDSLNAMIARTELSGIAKLRHPIETLIKTPASQLQASIFVFEKTGLFEVEEFLVDIVIELEQKHNHGAQRTLRVVKARDHAIDPLAHEMTISRTGVDIHLNPASDMKSIFWSDNSGEKDEKLPFGVPGLDEDFVVPSGTGTSSGIKSGSSTLLWGDWAIFNDRIALQFLLVSSEIAASYVHIGPLDQASETLVWQTMVARPASFSSIELDTTGVSTTKLLWHVLGKLSTKGSVHVGRVAVSNVHRLLRHHSAEDVVVFVETLCKVLKKCGVSSLLTFTLGEYAHDGFKDLRSMFEIFENLVLVRRLEEEKSGAEHLTVSVKQVNGTNVSAPNKELVEDEKTGKIIAVPGVFKHLQELPSHQLGVGEVSVYYHVEPTAPLIDLYEYLQGAFAATMALDFHAFSNRQDRLRNIKAFGTPDIVLGALQMVPPHSRTADSTIVTFDEYWAAPLIRKGRLARLSGFEDRIPFTEFLGEPSSLMSAVTDNNEIYGAPFYINFSLLVYRRDLLKTHRPLLVEKLEPASKKISRTGKVKSALTWKELLDVSNVIQEVESEQGRSNTGFTLDHIGPECLSSFVLELLWAPPFVQEKNGSVRFNFSSDEAELEKLVDALENLHKGHQKCLNLCGGVRSSERDFVFSRMWLSRYCELIQKDQKGGERQLDWCPVPSIKPDVIAHGICGEWFLGVLDGAFNTGWAAEIVGRLAGFEANSRIANGGGALPAWGQLWEASRIVDPHILKHYEQCKRRSRIPNYFQITPHLRKLCQSILTGKKPLDKTEISKLLMRIEERGKAEKSTFS